MEKMPVYNAYCGKWIPTKTVPRYILRPLLFMLLLSFRSSITSERTVISQTTYCHSAAHWYHRVVLYDWYACTEIRNSRWKPLPTLDRPSRARPTSVRSHDPLWRIQYTVAAAVGGRVCMSVRVRARVLQRTWCVVFGPRFFFRKFFFFTLFSSLPLCAYNVFIVRVRNWFLRCVRARVC